jgi:D-alanyl-D-alanine carboxypeptidase (penicillin-binding protein 5/6)
MKKCVLSNCLFFLLVFMVSGAQSGPIICASAPSGSHVYRASVGPRPDYTPPPAAGNAKTAPSEAEPASDESSTASKVANPPAAQPGQGAMIKKAVSSIQPLNTAPAKTSPAQPASASSVAGSSPQASPKSVPAAKSESKPAPRSESKAASTKSAPKSAPAAAAGKTRKGEPPATAKDLLLNVQAAILINMSTGQVYYEHNPDKAIQPASITKLLTLYLVREAMAQGRLAPTTPIPVSAKAVQTGGSRMRLKRGEKVPLNELIKGISVVSANNACVAVAEYMGGGDPSKFVSQMNDKARKIGMTSSRFKNPSGLPDRTQLSTARDIAKLSMSYLRTFPESLKVHSMTSHTYHGSTHRNANTLLKTYKGADGLKTGFVCEAGYNITATAKRGDTRLLAVVLGAQSSSVRLKETRKLLDFGFKRAARDNGLGNRAAAGGGKPDV